MANQLVNRTSIFALDALKNLCIQGYLMNREDLALLVINQGYIQCVNIVVEKAINLLDHESKLQRP